MALARPNCTLTKGHYPMPQTVDRITGLTLQHRLCCRIGKHFEWLGSLALQVRMLHLDYCGFCGSAAGPGID
jgi:hypothetical protein